MHLHTMNAIYSAEDIDAHIDQLIEAISAYAQIDPPSAIDELSEDGTLGGIPLREIDPRQIVPALRSMLRMITPLHAVDHDGTYYIAEK